MRPACEDPLGCPAPAMAGAFLPGLAVSHRPPSPAAFTTGSSSRELYVSSRVLRPTACPSSLELRRPCDRLARERKAPPWGFRPSSRHQPAASTHRPENPSPELWSVLDVSHVLDGLLRHRPCGFISPRSHVQGFPSGVCPFRRSRTRFPAPLPSCRLDEPACRLPGASEPAPDCRALLPARSAVTSARG